MFPVSDLMVPYWACPNCGFVFTDLMDPWTPEDFRREIYNDDYGRANPPIPGRVDVPPRETPSYQAGRYIATFLAGSQPQIRILDFGSGGNPVPTGLALLDQGFTVHSYEPYRSNSSLVADGRHDVIIAIEVFEHCHDLADLCAFMKSHLSRDGVLWIQTMLHPHPTPADVLNSWYIAPRDGHVSIFSLPALVMLFRKVGINIVQAPFAILGFKNLPRFPNSIFV